MKQKKKKLDEFIAVSSASGSYGHNLLELWKNEQNKSGYRIHVQDLFDAAVKAGVEFELVKSNRYTYLEPKVKSIYNRGKRKVVKDED